MREHRLQIWQDGIMVAAVSGKDITAVRREAWNYARVYGQDGPVEIRGPDVHLMIPAEAKAVKEMSEYALRNKKPE